MFSFHGLDLLQIDQKFVALMLIYFLEGASCLSPIKS